MKKKIENSNSVTAIYVRRSVTDMNNNSLSIESQKEDCVYRIYCDSRFSGEDTEHSPAFQQMMHGLVSTIIVIKV